MGRPPTGTTSARAGGRLVASIWWGRGSASGLWGNPTGFGPIPWRTACISPGGQPGWGGSGACGGPGAKKGPGVPHAPRGCHICFRCGTGSWHRGSNMVGDARRPRSHAGPPEARLTPPRLVRFWPRLLSDARPRAGSRRKTRARASAAKHPAPEPTRGLAVLSIPPRNRQGTQWDSASGATSRWDILPPGVGIPPTNRKRASPALPHSLPPASHTGPRTAPRGGPQCLQVRYTGLFTCGNNADLRFHQPFTISFST